MKTPTYRMELMLEEGGVTPVGWDVGGKYGKGKANEANLRKHVEALEASCRPGGCNSHLGSMKVASARLVHQATNKVVAVLNFENPLS